MLPEDIPPPFPGVFSNIVKLLFVGHGRARGVQYTTWMGGTINLTLVRFMFVSKPPVLIIIIAQIEKNGCMNENSLALFYIYIYVYHSYIIINSSPVMMTPFKQL